MNKLDERKIDEIACQIDLAIEELQKKVSSSNEHYVSEMLKKYLLVKREVDDKGSSIPLSTLYQLLNGARGYMETSSDYSQNFLDEMGKVEKLIKSYC